MTQDEIIRMAKEACAPNQTFNSDPEWLERFAALIREDEREKIALAHKIRPRGKSVYPEFLAEQEKQQEPVAWMHIFMGVAQINTTPPEVYGDNWTHKPLYFAQPDTQQEPVEWQPIGTLKPTSDELDILMGDGSILCNVLTQSDGDLWWDGSGIGEKFIDPEYAAVTHWRKHSDSTPPTAAKAKTYTQEQVDALVANASRQMRDAAVKAWDEGYELGVDDERTSEANIGIAGFGAKVVPNRQNPYAALPVPEVQWRDLTDEEIIEVMATWSTAWMNLDPDTKPNGEIYIARAVIAADREKNK